MSVKVTDNTPQLKFDVQRKGNLALRFMLDAIDQESTARTPKDKGDLRMNKLKHVLGLSAVIQWSQEYAAIQESKQFQNYTTPGTGPHFAENAVRKVVNDSAKYFVRAGL